MSAYLNRAKTFFLLKDSKKAKNDFKKLIKIYPSNPDVFHDIGISYWDNKNIKNAEKMFEKCMDLDSKNPNIWYSISCFYAFKKKEKISTDLLFKVAMLNPEFVPYFEKDKSFDPIRSSKYFKEGMVELNSFYASAKNLEEKKKEVHDQIEQNQNEQSV